MSFSKAQRILNQVTNYNPPPGHYSCSKPPKKLFQDSPNPTFGKSQRFRDYLQGKKSLINNGVPGPGHYYSPKQQVKKRVFQEQKKRQQKQTKLLMNSIPSIPKTKQPQIYQQLPPGILILKQAQLTHIDVGPGSYNPKIISKKAPYAQILPQHKKKIQQQNLQKQTLQIPFQLLNTQKNQNRVQSKQINSNNNYYSKLKKPLTKHLLSQADLCLQLIILRQKQLKPDTIPPPGYYHNQKQFSSFKTTQKPPELQFLSGKTQRFEKNIQSELGPGKYTGNTSQKTTKKNLPGGFIAKATLSSESTQGPGPGTYQIELKQAETLKFKGKYPPIFGSGCARFTNQIKNQQQYIPGPGTYQIDRKNVKKKRPRTINVKQIETPIKNGQIYNNQQMNLMISAQTEFLFPIKNSRQNISTNSKEKHNGSFFFSSNIKRFDSPPIVESKLSPFNIENQDNIYIQNSKVIQKKSFNKGQTNLSKQERFKNKKRQQHQSYIGPGCYEIKDHLTKQKKYYEIKIK